MSSNHKDRRTKTPSGKRHEELCRRLAEAEQTLEAIHHGEVDGLVVAGSQGEQVYSLAGAEHVYRVIVETMNEAALTVDPNGTILFCNRRFCDLMKTSIQGAMGHKVTAFAAPPQQYSLRKLLAEAHRGPVQRHLLLRAADGTPVPVQLAASPLEVGDHPSICLVASDLTELEASAHSVRVLREHQQALEESEHRYRELLRCAPAGIYEIDFRRRRVTSVNDAMCQLSGYSREELLAMNPLDLLDEDGQVRFRTRINKWRSGEEPDRNVEYRVKTKEGRTLDVLLEVTFTTDADGRPLGATVVGHDITERKKAEEALHNAYEDLQAQAEQLLTANDLLQAKRHELEQANDNLQMQEQDLRRHAEALQASQERLALAASGTRIGMYEWNVTTGATLWTEQVAQLLGLRTTTTTISQPYHYQDWAQCVHPEDLPRVEAELRRCRTERAPYEAQYRVVWPDGSVHWVADRGVFQYEFDGQCTRMLGILTDITERKRAEAALRQSTEQLALELAATRRLQEVSTQLIEEENVETLYDKILDAAMAILRSDFASIQMLHPERGPGGELRLLGQRGFTPEAAKFWEWVRPASKSTCGIALQTGQRVIAPDVRTCEFMAGSDDQETYLQTGIQAVQTTPLVSRCGRVVGMISTHWRQPHQPTEHDLRVLDVLARQTADLIERSQAQKALRESEERFRTTFEKGPVAMALTALDSTLLKVNASFCRMLGFNESELVGRSFTEITHPDDRAANLVGTQRLACGAIASFRMEKRCIRKDGAVLWADMSTASVPDAAGRPLYCVTHVQDVTERKQAEEALRENQALVHAVMDGSPDLIYVKDRDGRILMANPAACEALGRPAKEVIGKSAREFHRNDPEVGRAILENDRHIMESGQTETIEELGSKGRTYLSTKAPYRDAAGNVIGLLGISHDITDRQRAEEALRENEFHLARAQQMAHLGSWSWDIVADHLYWSDETYRLFGLQPGELVPPPRDFLGFIHPEDRQRVEKAVQEALAHGPCQFDFRIVRQGGEERYVHSEGQTTFDPEGHPVTMEGTLQDITERRRAVLHGGPLAADAGARIPSRGLPQGTRCV